MAYFRKLPSGKWRAEIELLGVRRSQAFQTKSHAREWATAEEAAITASEGGQFPARTMSDAIDRYLREVSAKKEGRRWEELRLRAFERDFPTLAGKLVSKIAADDMAGWRDARLRSVSTGTVLRETNLLRNVFSVARDEWRWRDGSPFVGVKAPQENPARTRRVLPAEVRRICRWLGYRTGHVETKMQEVAFAFLVSLRTGMRAGEVLSLEPKRVDLAKRVVRVPHKMQYLTGRLREVPLMTPAVRLLRSRSSFTVSSESLDALFRKATSSLLIEDLHFHDARAEALTRFSRKMDVMTLARISGHKDLRILMDRYYRESIEQIAARLA
jgi:integrase